MDIAKDKVILLVEDSHSLRRTITDILRAAGAQEVYPAEDGKVGLERLHDLEKVDLVVLDWDMPVMNGMEMLKALRASEEPYRDVPVLMLTAHASEIDVITAIQNGANNYVVKPFAPATLFNKLKTIFDNADKG